MGDYIRITEEMLDKKWAHIPESLQSRLEAIDNLAALAGGALVSRQAIAIIIHQWKNETTCA